MELTPELKREMYRTMLLSRRLDERAWVLHRQNKITFHISAIGHEAVQVGAGFALKRGEDWVAPYARDLPLLLSLGLKPRDFILMLMGKAGESDSGGRQMPGNWSMPSAHVISTSGVAAAQVLHAVGIAQGMQIRHDQGAVLASCGEGATSMGEWYEAANWAAVHHLPVVFLVQNNGLALSTRQAQQMLRPPATKASGLGLPGKKVDGITPFIVYEMVAQALEEARIGKGPSLIEVMVQRIPPHSSDDDDRMYRTRDEVEEARRTDPLYVTRTALLKEGTLTQLQVEEIEEDVKAVVDEAVRDAERAPLPAPEEAAGPVFADLEQSNSQVALPAVLQTEKEMTMLEALNLALDDALGRDERTVLLGMDIGVKGGVFRVTEGLLEKYGPERVMDVPLSGAALVGVGVGLALYGLLPICEIQFADFIFPAFNQIINEAARIHYRSGGAWRVPMILRVPYGGGGGGGLYHSQSIEAFLTHVPGLKVVVPSDPAMACSLLQAAVQDPNPVVFLEPKRGYRLLKSSIKQNGQIHSIGSARITMPGSDLSVVCYGMMHHLVMQAAEALLDEDICAEVIDLCSLQPLDEETILKSVQKTGKVLIVYEDNLFGGYGAEIAARVADQAFLALDAPVKRLASPDVPAVPFSPAMQDWFMLNREKIMNAIRSLARF